MLRRWVEYDVPISHLNGKLAPSSDVCSFQPEGDTNGVSYIYGYKHFADTTKSLFAVRSKCRNLSVNPITSLESDNWALFMATSAALSDYWQDDTKHLPDSIIKAFSKQRKYKRLYNYCWALVRANDGVIPW